MSEYYQVPVDMTRQEHYEIVKSIISLVESVQDNDFACWSLVTHVIFEDYNIGKHSLEYVLHDVNATKRWQHAIESFLSKHQDNNVETYLQYIAEIDITIETLQKLYSFTEYELDVASTILWTNWKELTHRYGISELDGRQILTDGKAQKDKPTLID